MKENRIPSEKFLLSITVVKSLLVELLVKKDLYKLMGKNLSIGSGGKSCGPLSHEQRVLLIIDSDLL